MRILMVEDSEAVSGAMTGALELRGHEVVLAESLAQAMEHVGGEPNAFAGFDVLLIDHELPDGVGLTLLRLLDDRDVAQRALQVPSVRPKTIYWSGLDRTRELEAAGLRPDVLMTKERMPELIDEIGGSDGEGRTDADAS